MKDVRVHDQGGVDLLGRGIAQQHQLFGQLFQQRFGRAGVAEDQAHLLLDVDRLGERAQVQTDHRALDPLAGGGQRVKRGRRGRHRGGGGMERQCMRSVFSQSRAVVPVSG